MSLPYENATSGKNAVAEIQKILQGFGASSFGVMEDFTKGEVLIQFEWHGRRVSLTASAKGYASAWLKEHPHSKMSRISPRQHQERALKKGNIAVYSILRDWIKGQATAVEVGMLTFEGAFLGQILLPTGETVLDHAQKTGLLQIEGPRQ